MSTSNTVPVGICECETSAHYSEGLVFKGSPGVGVKDWALRIADRMIGG